MMLQVRSLFMMCWLSASVLFASGTIALSQTPTPPEAAVSESPWYEENPYAVDQSRLEDLVDLGGGATGTLPKSGQPSPSPTIDEYIERGYLYLKVLNDAVSAGLDADAALTLVPNYPPAVLLKAKAQKASGDLASAVASYTSLMSVLDNDVSAPLLYEIEIDELEYGKQLQEESDPNATAILQLAAGHAAALSALTVSADNSVLTARANRQLGSSGDALTAYSHATAIDDCPIAFFVEKAEYEVELGASDSSKYGDAIETYLSAVDRLGLTEENLQWVHPRPSPAPSAESFPPEWRIRLAQLMKAHQSGTSWRDQLDEAIEALHSHLAVEPPSPRHYAYLALAKMELGNELSARSDARKAWELQYGEASSPGDRSVCCVIATILGESSLPTACDYSDECPEPSESE